MKSLSCILLGLKTGMPLIDLPIFFDELSMNATTL